MCYKRSSPANILIFSMLLTPTLLRWYFFTSSSVQLMPKIKSFILFLFSLHTINYLSLELHQLPHCLTKKVTLLRCSWQLLDFITIQRIWLLRISGLAINGTPQGKTVWKKGENMQWSFPFFSQLASFRIGSFSTNVEFVVFECPQEGRKTMMYHQVKWKVKKHSFYFE